jgi:hypothetical protein
MDARHASADAAADDVLAELPLVLRH